jgi:hypothetical protein
LLVIKQTDWFADPPADAGAAAVAEVKLPPFAVASVAAYACGHAVC